MKLYELTENYVDILDLIERDGEKEVLIDTLDMLKDSIDDKVENIAKIIKETESNIDKVDQEIKRLQNKKKTLKNNNDSLKEYLLEQLEKSDIKKINTNLFSVSVRNNPVKIVVTDESKLPDEFFIIKKTVDKTKIKEYLKHDFLDGVVREQSKRVQID